VTPGVTEEDVLKTYVKCQRAQRLLQNEDFIAWKKDVEAGKERMIRKLISQGEGGDRKRGMIVAIEKLYSEKEIRTRRPAKLAQINRVCSRA
jgi:hypothetical protein